MKKKDWSEYMYITCVECVGELCCWTRNQRWFKMRYFAWYLWCDRGHKYRRMLLYLRMNTMLRKRRRIYLTRTMRMRMRSIWIALERKAVMSEHGLDAIVAMLVMPAKTPSWSVCCCCWCWSLSRSNTIERGFDDKTWNMTFVAEHDFWSM